VRVIIFHLDGECERLTRQAIELALNGDLQALKMCLERILPPVRECPCSFKLPPISTAAEAAACMGLKLSPSSCSAYRRFFECHDDLQPALAWAVATNHRWASCRSVERLLRNIAEWNTATRGDSVSAPKPRRKTSEIIAELQQQLANADAEFVALRDPLLPEIEARAKELAAPAAAGDIAAREELAGIARRFHWRYRDLETCSALQLSKPGAGEPDDTHLSAPEPNEPILDEVGAIQDQGNPASSPPVITPASKRTAPLLRPWSSRPGGSGHSRLSSKK